ncbi:MAG: GNAT family N-acetyltransferase [Oscillospiraceae bacterium]|nr:GNAT family N-acetyltransferase [Oscillospiraceae bacterium]MBR6657089.1 GNAT family N-acetyltransferase [Oscillospiraceae bacterium]
MINFRKITEENFDKIIKMKRPKGEDFLCENSVALAQAWLYKNDGDVFSFAVYNDEECVGFMQLEEDTEEKELIIWRIMFPEENTNKGYGTAAVKLVAELAKNCGKYDHLLLGCKPENKRAFHVYEKLGFKTTGKIEYGEAEMILTL